MCVHDPDACHLLFKPTDDWVEVTAHKVQTPPAQRLLLESSVCSLHAKAISIHAYVGLKDNHHTDKGQPPYIQHYAGTHGGMQTCSRRLLTPASLAMLAAAA